MPCSNPRARFVVEYSLTPCRRLSNSTIFKAINEMEWDKLTTTHLLSPYLPRLRLRSFWLLGTDVTQQPRQFAHTLAGRGMVYQPNAIKGNKPVTIGHQYSTTVLLPEAEGGMSPSWVIPLMTCRCERTSTRSWWGCQVLISIDINHLIAETSIATEEKP